MDKHSDMAILVAVVDAGGFSPAARSLNITHSAISKRIQRLEERLGIQLLTRTTRFMQLTEVGAIYVREARVILDKIQTLERVVSSDSEVPRGSIRVSASNVFGRHFVTPALIGFLDRYPEIKIDLVLTDEFVDLKQDRIDMAIRIGHMPVTELSCVKLGESPRTLCASPVYLDVHGKPVVGSDLVKHVRLKLNFDTEMNELAEITEPSLRAQAPSRFTCNSVEAIHTACLAGHGIALLPDYLIAQDIADGRLISLSHPAPDRLVPSIYAVVNSKETLPARLTILLDYISKMLAAKAQGSHWWASVEASR
ncbi:LysR family transcriptional regulator [Pseudomonas sp. UV AK001]|uniref:LysR family transcriptional regulator n=1 Tax=Pseudomonas sp. UV AK001 TaxID=3384791 RepID=UPI0038D43BF2